MKQTTEQQIETLQAEILDLTFERAFGYEAQRKFDVWESLQKQIEQKKARVKALKGDKPTFKLGE